ncbi:MAG: hypothetical protein Q8R32_01470, partial [bacterium]|nr:hypothetical protein [bacterium]
LSGRLDENPSVLLTQLLTSRGAALVARRSGIRPSEEEVDTALRVLGTTTAAEPAIQTFLATRKVDLQSAQFRLGVRELLLHGKLAAVGVQDVWGHPSAPKVLVLHARYRWNASARSIESR